MTIVFESLFLSACFRTGVGMKVVQDSTPFEQLLWSLAPRVRQKDKGLRHRGKSWHCTCQRRQHKLQCLFSSNTVQIFFL